MEATISKNALITHQKSEFFQNFVLASLRHSYISITHQKLSFHPPFPSIKNILNQLKRKYSFYFILFTILGLSRRPPPSHNGSFENLRRQKSKIRCLQICAKDSGKYALHYNEVICDISRPWVVKLSPQQGVEYRATGIVINWLS